MNNIGYEGTLGNQEITLNAPRYAFKSGVAVSKGLDFSLEVFVCLLTPQDVFLGIAEGGRPKTSAPRVDGIDCKTGGASPREVRLLKVKVGGELMKLMAFLKKNRQER